METIDVEQAEQDAGEAVMPALEAPDPEAPEQLVALVVVDGQIKIFVKENEAEENDQQEIPVNSPQFHNALSAIVDAVMAAGNEKAVNLLKDYIANLYPDADERFILSRYDTLADTDTLAG